MPTNKRAKTTRLGQPRGAATKEHRLDDVIVVATRLFRERGFRGTRLDDIAEELGVTRAALYYYFNGKRDVLEEVCDRAMVSTERVLREVEALDDPSERLRRFARRYGANMSSDAARVFWRDHAELSPAFRRSLNTRIRAVNDGAEALFRYGIEQGDFRADIDVRVTTLGFLGTFNALSEWFRPGRDGSLQDVIDVLVEVYISGMAVRAAPPAEVSPVPA